MFKRKRKGMALITVVLISALLFVSIIGITLKVVPENKIIAARSASQRALEAAETGLSQVAFDIRNTHFEKEPPIIEPTGLFFHYLKINEVGNIPKLSIGSVISSFSEGDYIYSSGPPYVRYKVKIIKIGGYVNPSWTPTAVIDKPINIRVYVLGTVYKDSSTSLSSVLARRIISADYEVFFKQESTPVVFNYALFSGGKIDFTGSSDVDIAGNIFANGKIKFVGDCNFSQFGDPLADSSIFAHEGVSGSGLSGDYDIPDDPPPEIPFPQLNLTYYQDLAYKFKIGEPPYNGTVVTDPDTGDVLYTYPDTSELIVMAVVQSYLGTGASSTIDQIQNFYNDLKNKSGGFTPLTVPQWQSLLNNVKSIVYYIDGDAKIKNDFYCEGVIVISGKLVIEGSGNVNPGVSIPNLSLLVEGDIQINNNVAQLNGLIYTEGHLIIAGGSEISVTGSLVSKNNISLNNIASITYVPLDIPNTSITGAATITKAEQTSSSWKEISFDVFQNP
jgi:hypothetical protein